MKICLVSFFETEGYLMPKTHTYIYRISVCIERAVSNVELENKSKIFTGDQLSIYVSDSNQYLNTESK